MSNSFFRRAALERLSSPEQLDQLIHITHPRAWLLLLGLIAVILALLVWGAAGQVSNQVEVRTILLEFAADGAPLRSLLYLPAAPANMIVDEQTLFAFLFGMGQ
jgi:hypothetical protein